VQTNTKGANKRKDAEVFSKLSGQVIRHTGVEVVIGGFWDFAGSQGEYAGREREFGLDVS